MDRKNSIQGTMRINPFLRGYFLWGSLWDGGRGVVRILMKHSFNGMVGGKLDEFDVQVLWTIEISGYDPHFLSSVLLNQPFVRYLLPGSLTGLTAPPLKSYHPKRKGSSK